MRLPFYVGEPQKRPFAWFELGKDLRDRCIVFIARCRDTRFLHCCDTLLKLPAPPTIHDQITGDAIQVASPLLFVITPAVGAQHPQEGLLNDVVSIGGVTNDAVDITAESGYGAGVERRKRRLIETAHTYRAVVVDSRVRAPSAASSPICFEMRYDNAAATRNPTPKANRIVAMALVVLITSAGTAGENQP